MNSDMMMSSQNKRFIKFKKNLQNNILFFKHNNPKDINHPPIFTYKMHVPGKINFHQLLSKPLQKQIHKQNSVKQNKTFSLKFQPQISSRQSYRKNHFKQNLIRFSNTCSLSSNLHQNINKIQSEKPIKQSDQENSQFQLKQASKTMYFKPLGKVSQFCRSPISERKSMQILKNRSLNKNKQNPQSTNGFKDKLLMLLQIRRQQTSEKYKDKQSKYLRNSQNKKFRLNKSANRQTQLIRSDKEEIDHQKRAQSSLSLNDYRKKLTQKGFQLNWTKKSSQQHGSPSMLSPWHLVQNVQQF